MKYGIKIITVLSTLLVSSTALGVAGLDRLVFTPSFLFEKGNYAEITLARADPTVTTSVEANANVAELVDTLGFAYKHQISDKLGLGFLVNTQPAGVDINYSPLGDQLRGSMGAKSYIALAHYTATDRIDEFGGVMSAFGGIKYQTQGGNADLETSAGIPGALTLSEDFDAGVIIGGAHSIPKIAFRASLWFETDLKFAHNTTSDDLRGNAIISAVRVADSTSAAPEALTFALQSGIAKNTLLFSSVRMAKWSNAQINLLGLRDLSSFDDTTVYKLGMGRQFGDYISGSITLNYEGSNGKPSSPFSPQDGERGIAIGGKFTAKNGFAASIGAQYRELGDTVTTPTAALASQSFVDNDVVTVGLKFSKSF